MKSFLRIDENFEGINRGVLNADLIDVTDIEIDTDVEIMGDFEVDELLIGKNVRNFEVRGNLRATSISSQTGNLDVFVSENIEITNEIELSGKSSYLECGGNIRGLRDDNLTVNGRIVCDGKLDFENGRIYASSIEAKKISAIVVASDTIKADELKVSMATSDYIEASSIVSEGEITAKALVASELKTVSLIGNEVTIESTAFISGKKHSYITKDLTVGRDLFVAGNLIVGNISVLGNYEIKGDLKVESTKEELSDIEGKRLLMGVRWR